ncbi:MAG TPA: bestrophin family ion channel, partial [Mycobacterium sp.]|nr:bestrophin family ion channel [Mycobacterium sp.]
MIRSVGRLGPVKAAGLVAWQLRYDLLAVLVVAAIMVPIPDAIQSESVAVLSVLGIAASIFIGFRNSNAYNRWWEARTLWGGIIINSRALHNTLCSVDTGAPAMCSTLDRMRRRQVRYVWQLAAEMRGIAPLPGVAELTPEDGPDPDATDLLALQARDVQTLYADGYIDEQARVMLMSVNTGTVTAQSGLERIRNQPVPIQYDLFIRGLAWLFAIVAFNRLDSSSHHLGGIVVGVLLGFV